mgnify:CR=1 FL=1
MRVMKHAMTLRVRIVWKNVVINGFWSVNIVPRLANRASLETQTVIAFLATMKIPEGQPPKNVQNVVIKSFITMDGVPVNFANRMNLEAPTIMRHVFPVITHPPTTGQPQRNAQNVGTNVKWWNTGSVS